MKKTVTFGLVFLFAAILIASTTWAAECTGCTPGYWKQAHHFGNWLPDYNPYNSTVLGEFGCGPDMLLLDALKAKGGGENALLRHATAALLNNGNIYVTYFDGELAALKQIFCEAMEFPFDYESAKDIFADRNEEYYCPLKKAEWPQ